MTTTATLRAKASHLAADFLITLTAMTNVATADAPQMLTVSEVADALRVSTETVRRRVADQTICGVTFGRVIRIPRVELERLLDDTANSTRR